MDIFEINNLGRDTFVNDVAPVQALYHQRNKCETIFSVIKRRFGSEVNAYHNTMKEKELLYRVLAYNCHRMCMISRRPMEL